jgi:hypothetical protein
LRVGDFGHLWWSERGCGCRVGGDDDDGVRKMVCRRCVLDVMTRRNEQTFLNPLTNPTQPTSTSTLLLSYLNSFSVLADIRVQTPRLRRKFTSGQRLGDFFQRSKVIGGI